MKLAVFEARPLIDGWKPWDDYGIVPVEITSRNEDGSFECRVEWKVTHDGLGPTHIEILLGGFHFNLMTIPYERDHLLEGGKYVLHFPWTFT